jgi:3-oxoacyl-[acyl-carrier protein] reductase
MSELKFSFPDKHIVVTGGAQGIGFEITKLFLEAGARVSVADYSEESLAAAKKELSSFPLLETHRVDVTDRASCKAFAEGLSAPIHVLINNAGITRDKSFAKMTEEDFDKVIQTNLTGVFNVTKSLFQKFDEQKPKRIVNMASVVALYGNFGQTNYVAAKSGVVGMTKTWAREFGKKGFTVNAIAPGFILTQMTQAMPKEVLDGIAARVPVGRLGEPQDIARTCLFLSSEEAAYINGAVISVDGGLIL